MNKLQGRKVRLKDGREGELSGTVIKSRKGWEYFVHFPDGSCELLPRASFEYLKP